MDDSISRQAAIDAISCDITVTGRQNAELVAATIGTFVDRIKALPSADRTGEWEAPYVLKDGSIGACCSQCGAFLPTTCDYNNYCPNCGSYNGGEK